MGQCPPIITNRAAGLGLEKRKPKRIGWKWRLVLIAGLLWLILWHVRGEIYELWLHPPTASEVKEFIGIKTWQDFGTIGGLIIINGLIYVLVVRALCPTTARTLGRLGNAVMAMAGGDEASSYEPGERASHWRDFFIVFILPFLCYGAGLGEWYAIQYWLYGTMPG
jgi:hypothetical protein